MKTISKRKKIAISSAVLSLMLFSIPFLTFKWSLGVFAILALASYGLSVWSLLIGLLGIEFITLFILPVLHATTFGLLFLQVDLSLFFKVLLTIVFGITLYIILLAENIYNVSAERSIPLLRAAHTVGYIVTLFVSFAFFSLLFGVGINLVLLTLISFVVGTLLFLQSFWQIDLKEFLSSEVLLTSVICSLILSEIIFVSSFWPFSPAAAGLASATGVYVLIGIINHKIKGDLSVRAVKEYLFVGIAVFILMLVLVNS